MTELPRRVTSINMSAIPVNGVGGLGMIAIAVVIAIEYPEAHWLLALSLIGGVCMAAGTILWRRTHRTEGPSGDHPGVLFASDAATDAARLESGHRSIEQLAAAH